MRQRNKPKHNEYDEWETDHTRSKPKHKDKHRLASRGVKREYRENDE